MAKTYELYNEANTKVLGSAFMDEVMHYHHQRTDISPQVKYLMVNSLKSFCQFSGKEALDNTHKEAFKYYDYLLAGMNLGNIKPSYVRTKISHLKQMYAFIYGLHVKKDITKVYPCNTGTEGIFSKVFLTEVEEKLEFDENDFITVKDLDIILSLCDTLDLKFAIMLASKMCLKTSEISNLKVKNIECHDGIYYIVLPWITPFGKTTRKLPVAADMTAPLLELIKGKSKEEYVICSKNTDHYSDKSLQRNIDALREYCDFPDRVKFQKIRNFGILTMVKKGVPIEKLSMFTGQEGSWLYRFYAKVLDEKILKEWPYYGITFNSN